MARSKYVYCVINRINGFDPSYDLETFTVKHEMVSWIKLNLGDSHSIEDWEVWRGEDGGGLCEYQGTAKDFLEN